MAIPDDIDGLCRTASESRTRDDAHARAARRFERRGERKEELRQLEAARHTPDAAHAVWAWLAGAEGEQLRTLLRKYRLTDVRLFGPVWNHDGSNADGLRTGSVVLHVVTNEPAVRVNERGGPAWGLNEVVREPDRLLKVMQPIPLLRLAEEIRTGALWDRLRDELKVIRK